MPSLLVVLRDKGKPACRPPSCRTTRAPPSSSRRSRVLSPDGQGHMQPACGGARPRRAGAAGTRRQLRRSGRARGSFRPRAPSAAYLPRIRSGRTFRSGGGRWLSSTRAASRCRPRSCPLNGETRGGRGSGGGRFTPRRRPWWLCGGPAVGLRRAPHRPVQNSRSANTCRG